MKKFKKLRTHHKVIFIILGLIGSVSIWRGIWNLLDLSPVLANPFASIAVGFILLIISGVFYKLF